MLMPRAGGLSCGLVLAAAVVAGAPAAAAAQAALRLSIDDAMARAAPASESLAAARAGVESARQQIDQARSGWLPQLTATAAYSRTLKSEFEGISFGPPPDMMPDEETDFDLPFGQSNTWRAGLSLVQPLYDGGRTGSSLRLARAGVASAKVSEREARAVAVLAAAQAYYDAALAARQVEIAEASLAQAEKTLEQTRASNAQGAVPEFDVLRAEVARDNQRNALVRFTAQREVALVQLRRTIGVEPGAAIELTSPLEVEASDQLGTAARGAAGLTDGARRTIVEQAEQLVKLREASVGVAKADRLPQVVATSDLGFVDYPEGFLFDTDWRTNWSVGVSVSFPVFDGFRRRAVVRAARADVAVARARLAEVTEVAAVEAAQIDATVAAAETVWQSSARTITQAERAYQIAEVRYQQGASTQLELDETRLGLQQAQLEHARAARDLRVARLRRDLLAGLPLAGP